MKTKEEIHTALATLAGGLRATHELSVRHNATVPNTTISMTILDTLNWVLGEPSWAVEQLLATHDAAITLLLKDTDPDTSHEN